MKGKTLITLVIAAAVLGGLAVLTSNRKHRPMPAEVGKALLPGLALDKVARVTLVADGKTSTVSRVDDAWAVAEKHNYPADFGKLKGALVKLADLKVGQTVTVGDAQKAGLKLTPETASRLVLEDEAGATLASVMIGETREAQSATSGRGGYPDGRFVSTDGGKTVSLVADALHDFAETDPTRWVNAEVANLTGSDVAGIRVTGPDRAPVELARGADGKLTLGNLAEGETFDDSKVYALESALSYLRFEDIADPAMTDDAMGFGAPVIYEATTKKGVLHVVKIGGKAGESENRYARFSVSYAGAGTPVPADETEEAKKTREAEEGKVRDEAAALNRKLANWTYVIPSYKAETMLKPRTDLLKQKTDEEKKDADMAAVGADKTPAPDAAGAAAAEAAAPAETPKDAAATAATNTQAAVNK